MNDFSFRTRQIFALSCPLNEYRKVRFGGITLFSFGALSCPVNLIKEVTGEEKNISLVRSLSEKTGGTVIVGCDLLLGSKSKLSAIVTHNGTLCDVVDSCTPPPPYVASNTVKIFNSGTFLFSLLVGNDVKSRLIVKKTAMRCDVIIALCNELYDGDERLVRTLSTEVNKPILFHSPTLSFFAQPMRG